MMDVRDYDSRVRSVGTSLCALRVLSDHDPDASALLVEGRL